LHSEPMSLPPSGGSEEIPPQTSTGIDPIGPIGAEDGQASTTRTGPEYTVPRAYSPERQPTFVRNATSPQNPTSNVRVASSAEPKSGLFGPVGYDTE
jgi:hypothetical protein